MENILPSRLQILRGHHRARTGYSVAVPGTSLPGSAGRRTAAGTTLATGMATAGFGWSCSQVSELSR